MAGRRPLGMSPCLENKGLQASGHQFQCQEGPSKTRAHDANVILVGRTEPAAEQPMRENPHRAGQERPPANPANAMLFHARLQFREPFLTTVAKPTRGRSPVLREGPAPELPYSPSVLILAVVEGAPRRVPSRVVVSSFSEAPHEWVHRNSSVERAMSHLLPKAFEYSRSR